MCNVKRIVQQRIQMQLHKSAPTQKGRVGLPCLLQVEMGRGEEAAADQAKVMSVNQRVAAESIAYTYSYRSL